MANSYQTAAFNRKVSYFVLMVAIFVVTLFLRGTIPVSDQVKNLTVAGRANNLQLTTLSNGGASQLTGQAIRLVLTGSQGLVTCGLWLVAQEKQKNQEWSKVEVLVDSVTKLQPNFLAPWLFQSWNLTYNISVELARLNDMYFYIARGISLLSEGEAINSESPTKGSPDMRYSIAFYYQNKFTVSDKVNTLRCLYDLSCIPPDERKPQDYMSLDGKEVNLEAFEGFCKKHPQLVRRLRESTVALSRPRDIVQFLKENIKVPMRYSNGRDLAEGAKQFPVLPPQFLNDEKEELTPKNPITDRDSDALFAARVWYRYSMVPLPPPTYHPVGTATDEMKAKYRIPKQPSTIIFLQGAPRAQSYVAERLQKEGWIDGEYWKVDEYRDLGDSERWFDAEVAIEPTMTSGEAWEKAFRIWSDHGQKYGLSFDKTTLANYVRKATKFAQAHGMNAESASGIAYATAEDLNDPVMKESYEAMNDLLNYRYGIQVTNFKSHMYTSEIEMNPDTIGARKIFFQAEQYRKLAKTSKSIVAYEKAFDLWKKMLAKRPAGDEYDQEFEKIQEEMYENQINYMNLKTGPDLKKRREAMLAIHAILNEAGAKATGNIFQVLGDVYSLDQSQVLPLSDRMEPLPAPGPFDGNDPSGNPWIPAQLKARVKERIGSNKPAAQATPASPEPQAAPSGPK